jgi:two-component system, LuxR family, sensor histidine kinase DctS
MPSQPASSEPVTPRTLAWYLALPKLGIVLLVVAVLALLWLLHRTEVEEQRTTLIGDVLWLEQNIRFHLVGNEEQLHQLAYELVDTTSEDKTFHLRIANLLKNNPELEEVSWLDSQQHIIAELPARADAETGELAALSRAFDIAQRLRRPAYSAPYFTADRSAHVDVVVPIFRNEKFAGALVGNYALEPLLRGLVPWWFAQKYRVRLIDDDGVQYASKSNVGGDPSSSYQLALDPPGSGMLLEVQAYHTAGNSAQRLLAGTIIVLAGIVLSSLWGIRSQMRRRHAAELALREEHAFRESMENSLTVGMRARDLGGRIIYVNPAFCRMTGFSTEELIGCAPPMPYWEPEAIAETMAMHEIVLSGKAPADGFDINFRRRNGERFQALIYEAPLIDGNGHQTGWMGSVLDVTERRRTEELARQQEEKLQVTARLVTMGEMASTLAHELNQPLAAIASYNAGCLNKLEAGNANLQDIRDALGKLAVQAQRAGRIIRRVHDFVRRSEPRRAACRLREVIDDCIGFTEGEAKKRGVRFDCALPADLPEVHADRLMIEQVLLNLIRNAMEAMSATPPEQRRIRIHALTIDEQVEVSVADCGCGLAPDIQEKLFTAFFSTKEEGMGIGLSICRSIIEFHHGQLWVEKNPGAAIGTCFYFTLPRERA